MIKNGLAIVFPLIIFVPLLFSACMVSGFNKLTICERANLLWSKGKFLATTKYYHRKVNLYSMDGEYYEIWYDVAGDLIEKIVPMKNSKIFAQFFQEN